MRRLEGVVYSVHTSDIPLDVFKGKTHEEKRKLYSSPYILNALLKSTDTSSFLIIGKELKQYFNIGYTENFGELKFVKEKLFALTEGTILKVMQEVKVPVLEVKEIHDCNSTAPPDLRLYIEVVAKDRTIEEFLDSYEVLQKLPKSFEYCGKTIKSDVYIKKESKLEYIKRILSRKTDEKIADALELKEYIDNGISLFSD